MWTTLFLLMTALLQVVCRDQESCEIVPRNPIVPYGSDLTIFIKASSSSGCQLKTAFDPSRIFWTLNERKIDERFYDFNSTFASVSIRNLSVEKGTVKCFLNTTTPVLLQGTSIQTYPLVSSPQNVSCLGKMKHQSFPEVTCMWDHEPYPSRISYTVHLKQNEEYICESQKKICKFQSSALLEDPLNITVSAQNSYGYSARSKEVTYKIGWAIVQMEPPKDVIAEPLPTGFRVTWKIENHTWTEINITESEIRIHENGSYTEPVVKNVQRSLSSTVVTEVNPCTNYSVSVRVRYHDSVWSTWSNEVMALSYINVSSLQFHLWRSKSVLGDSGKRTVLLMWKGVQPSCKNVDGYCIFCDSLNHSKCFGPYENRMFITLDERPHRITVTAFRNETSLNEASVEVPGTAEEGNLPPVRNISVFVQHGCIHITWEKPSLPVSGYIIIWNSTAKNHMWQQTQETSFSLKGEPFILYTISLTPLYKDGPGNETTLHNCSQEGNLSKVSIVQMIEVSDKHAEIDWLPLLPIQCCAFVLNYTVFYRSYNETTNRNVTVGPNQHRVILKDLQARTTYSFYIMASTVAASSMSVPFIFSTKHNIKVYLILIICCVCLILLPTLAVMIRRKFLSKKIPDPRFSSLSIWPSDNCNKAWSIFPMPGGRDTEKILPCHVDSEAISVSPTSKKDTATLEALTDIQYIAIDDMTSQTENTPLAASVSKKGQLAFGGKEQRVPPVPSLDLQTSGTPPIQSLYRKQTPLCSPVDSPTKPLWSDETDALLTPKLKNTTYFTSYVTLDMFETVKKTTK
ncbi:granulocyte colony-stimulating factor receptor [Ictalurus punctatus]|uniref:Granulocyte colony-stimulating factor receptor n=1 Tax=Ictalurus punctatus TaxID=7998 RepID=A0A2D0SPU2_ICTPU|nr:granulocyte colony-stimulating factor receptor [Ictalurus punctatus]XP_053542945.1 granulocyte colony-stimulating factor receptor [Ictalurus punctatus]